MRIMIVLVALSLLLTGCGYEQTGTTDPDAVVDSGAEITLDDSANGADVVDDTADATDDSADAEDTTDDAADDAVNETVDDSVDDTNETGSSSGVTGSIYDEMSLSKIQGEPELVVAAYLDYITLAQKVDEAYWANAYMLISPTQKKNWAKFRTQSLYQDYLEEIKEFDKTGVVFEYIETTTLGTALKIHYTSSAGDMFYVVHQEDDLWYVYDGSKSGSMWWKQGQ